MRAKKYPEEILVGVNLSGELVIVSEQSLPDFFNHCRSQQPARYMLALPDKERVSQKRPIRHKKVVEAAATINGKASQPSANLTEHPAIVAERPLL